MRFKPLTQLALVGIVILALMGTLASAQDAGARVRFVHVIPAASAFDVYTDGQLTVSGLDFGQASSYINISAGEHQVAVTPAGLTTTLWQQPITVAAGTATTFIASSTDPLTFTPFDDDQTALPVGKTRLLIIHAVANGPTVDVMLSRGDRIATGLEYGKSIGTFDLPSLVYELGFVPAGGNLDKAIIPAQSYALNSGTRYMMVVYGTPTSPSVLLLSTPNTAASSSGFVRVAHTVAGAPAVDVYLDDTLVVPSLEFGKVTEHMPVDAGAHTVSLRPAGGTTDLVKADLTVEAGKAVTAVALGTPDKLQVQAFPDDMSGVAADKAVVSLMNTIPDSTNLSVKLADGTSLGDNVAFGAAGSAVNLTPADVPLSMTLTLGGQTGTLNLPAQKFYGGVYYDAFALSGTTFSPPMVIFASTSIAQGVASAPGAAGKTLTVAAQPTDTPDTSVQAAAPTATPVPPAQPTAVAQAAQPTQQPTSSEVVSAPPATAKPQGPTGTVLLDPDARLNLREYPRSDARVLGQVPSGTVLNVNGRVGEAALPDGATPAPDATKFVDPASLLTDPKQDLDPQQTWLNVTYATPDGGTITAWVLAIFLDVRNIKGERQRIADLPTVPENQPGEAANTAITPPPVQKDRVTVKVFNLDAGVNLSIRRTPDKEGEWLIGIPNGTVADFLGVLETRDWVFIRYSPPQGGSITGWVIIDYVEIYLNDKKVSLDDLKAEKLLVIADKDQRGEISAGAVGGSTPTPDPTKDAYVATIVLNSDARLNLRRTPDSNSEQIGQIPSGTQLIVTTRTPDGKWLKTTFEGHEGWISSQFVTLTFNGKSANVTDIPVEPAFSQTPQPATATPTG